MSKIIEVKGINPTIPESCFLAEGSIITGDVVMGKDCSIWFNAVIRGDVCEIRLGNKVNIQDMCMIHGTIGRSKTIIGNNSSIGHRAIIHGAIIEENVLIGMGAVVMDNAIIKSGALVAAGAVVLENQILEGGYIYAGVPAKKIKKLDTEQQQFHILRTSDAYIKYSSWYK
tara:strand:+ start:4828 stop:5340 length:513 start_codon:yes stop_codon:yes gene_type:complete